jgi:hypothetical protein
MRNDIMKKAEQWPANRGRLKMYLEPTDRIYFRKVTDNGTPESVGGGNAGKSCIAIMGIKEIEGLQKIGEFRGREEHQGLSVDILNDDILFSCVVDSRGYPASLGLPNAGKDVTIIVHGEEGEV